MQSGAKSQPSVMGKKKKNQIMPKFCEIIAYLPKKDTHLETSPVRKFQILTGNCEFC